MSEHPSFLVDEQQPKNRTILIWGLIIGTTVAIILVILSTVFYRTTDQAIYEKQLSINDSELELLKNSQKKNLHSYGWIDKEKQIVHIPIEEAMKKVVEQEKEMSR